MSPVDPGSRRRRLLVCAIVAAAAGLRGSGISAGAPYRMGIDEPVILEIALRMMQSGDFNPRFYDYGGLTIYLQVAMGCLTFLTGAMARQWSSLEQLWIGDLVANGRLVSVALGTATVWLVYLIGRRWGTATAMVAVVAMAVQPQHVRESHFALTDVPLTFFITLTLWLSIRGAETGRIGTYVLAGLAVGAAAATKYHGVLAVVMPLATVLALQPASRAGHAAAGTLAGCALGFLLGAPYSVLDLPAFLNGFASLMQHYNEPRPVFDSFVTYLKYMRGWFAAPPVVPAWFGWVGLAMCLGGLLLCLARLRDRDTRAPALAVVLFSVVFVLFISQQGSLQFGRYAMPVAPMLSIFLGLATVRLRSVLLAQPTAARRVAALAVFLVFVPPLASSIGRNLTDQRESTTDQLATWLVANLAPDDVVEMGADGLRLPPRFTIRISHRIVSRTVNDYRDDGVDYVVASSSEIDGYAGAPKARANELAAWTLLTRDAQTVQVFPGSAQHPGPTITILKVPR